MFVVAKQSNKANTIESKLLIKNGIVACDLVCDLATLRDTCPVVQTWPISQTTILVQMNIYK